MSTWQLYDYQKQCLRTLSNSRRDGKGKALVVMASGLGKTVIAAHDTKRYLKRYGGRVLFLCHQNDILDQAHETFESVLGPSFSMGYLNGNEKITDPVDVLFATFQTMHNDWRETIPEERFAYVIVDETHHAPAETYLPTLEYFNPEYLLGLTATPERGDLKDIREIYGDAAFSLPLEDALAKGLLAPVDYRLLTDELQNLGILDTPAGRLSIAQLNRKLFIPRRDKEIVRIIQGKTKGVENPRTMIFASTVFHCNALERIIPNSAAVHYEISDAEHIRRLAAFRSGEINTLITVDVFNEGIDIPDVNVIVFLRSTASHRIFLQQLGRGLRRAEGKDKVLVLDFVANCERLEIVHRLWSSVEEKQSDRPQRRRKSAEQPLIVDIGEVEFSEVALEVLAVIKNIRTGYTTEMLIKQLRQLAFELGHTPTAEEINEASKQGKIAGKTTFRALFGNTNIALEAAGLSGPRKRRTWKRRSDDEMLADFRNLQSDLKRTPTTKDIDKAANEGKMAWANNYRVRFGSFDNVLELMGISSPTARVGKSKTPRRRTDDELITDLVKLCEKLGRAPTTTEVDEYAKQGICAGSSVYKNRFGSHNESIRRTGFEPRRRGENIAMQST